MIPTQNPSTVTTQGLSEARDFTIATTGKAFKTLIDGLYADKITAPVRELMTNAFDSHAAVGKGDTPFKVTVPVAMDPIFAVRDYGEGMDHETVLNLYTTLFASSKENTNDQVGMLGLGSKSPFAYTDAFTVTCFDGTEQRVYAAFLEQDVPKLAVIQRSPSTEAKGVLVQFPVSTHDIAKFVKAIKIVALGFDVLPEFDGAEVTPREILHEGAGWRMYERSDDYYNRHEALSKLSIRQGCVVYPGTMEGTILSTMYMPGEVAMMVDIPVGTSDVSSSREALSGDDISTKAVAEYVDAAFADYKQFVQKGYNACTTQVSRMEFASKVDVNWRQELGLPRHLTVTLMNENWSTERRQLAVDKKEAGRFVLSAKKKMINYSFQFHDLHTLTFILEDDETLRRRSRILNYARRTTGVYLIPTGGGQEFARKRIQKTLNLDDSQFVLVADLMDPGPPARSANGKAASRVKKSALVERLDKGTPWCRSMRGKVTLPNLSTKDISGWNEKYESCSTKVPPMDSTVIAGALGAVARDNMVGNDAAFNEAVVRLTDKQIVDLAPNPQLEASVLLAAACATHETAWQEHVDAAALRQDLRRSTNGYNTGGVICEKLGIAGERLDTEAATAAYVLHGSVDSAVTVNFAAVEAQFNEIKGQFPMLFPIDSHEVEEYINNQITTNKENTPS